MRRKFKLYHQTFKVGRPSLSFCHVISLSAFFVNFLVTLD